MNVFDLPGPEFLVLFVTLLAAAGVLLPILRWLMRGPGDELPARGRIEPQALEAAYLARGRRATVDAAVAALTHRGVVKVKLDARGRPTLSAHSPLPSDATELETRVYESIVHHPLKSALLGPVRRAGADAADALAEPLRRQEMVMDSGRIAMVRFVPALPLMFCLLIGAEKLLVGLSRGRPIGFLAILLFANLVVTIVALGRYPHRTRRGDKLLNALRRTNAPLETTSPRHLAPGELALAFGLFGPAVLAAGPDSDLYNAMRRNNGNSTATCGSSGCGSSSCGSSSGGDGGGGGCGGGCGGCGG